MNNKTPEDPSDGYLVKYELILNEDGQAPDDFYGTYSGTEPDPTPIEVATDATSKVISFNIATANAKYARFVLMKNGEVQTNSSTAITVSGGQSSAERPKRGVYIYNSDGLGSSIDVTVTLDAGTYEDYQLVAYFSDEAPTHDGSTITKEPEILDEKQIYSFTYPVTTIDKYIAWNTNTTTIDLASFLSTDFPALTSSSTTGYIGWSVYDGPYGSGSPVNIQGNHWNPSTAPVWAMDFTQGATQTVWSVSDGAISENWAAYTNVPVYAPGSQKFEEYPNHIVVAEISDVSSSKIRVRYIFHFNADGLPPYELINETDIAADKTVIPITDYEAASGVMDVSDALVSGAKYARIYVSKYGNANAESASLTITYDGAPITQCATGNEKYGWYLSEAGGIDVSKLSLTGLTADEMLKYNVVIVSSDEELSGTQEPAWDKKMVYSFQKDIKIRVEGTDADQTLSINHQDAITTTLGSSVSDFSKYLYAKWYVLNPSGEKVSIGGTDASNSAWRFNIKDYSLQNWTLDGNELKYYTDNADRTSSAIEGGNGWTSQIAKISQLFVPFNDSKRTIDYAGYKIVFEFSDEYDTSTGIEPAYKLKYTTVIIDPNAFTGELSATGVTDGTTQVVARDAASVDVDLTTGAFAHSKLSGTDLKYARFYLTDANGNVVNPVGKLAVQYDGADATACTDAEDGFYIYLGPDGGGTIQTLDKSKIGVTLTAPKAYKLYKVVGVFSTEMTEVLPEGGATPLTREPDWELQYTYDFAYPDPTTNEISKTIEWRRMGMTAHASTLDPDADWNTSWEELSAGQYVKWYVVNGSGVQQNLVAGTERQTGTTDWAIDVADYTVDANAAVLTGQSTFTSIQWNTWGMPTIYAPAGVEFDDVQDFEVVCEIYDNSTGTGNPNARYTFSLYKSFLGELKDAGTVGGETVDVINTSTSETLTLSHATTAWGGGTAKYARVWLTTVNGDMVDPTGKLSVTGMPAYATEGNTDVKYGYYLSDDGGIDLGELTATVKLDAGFYDEYQVNVALSTEPLGTSEPDYNYIYTFGFSYPVKTKYKTLVYDSGNNSCTPHLLGNWQELAVDCSEGKTNLANKLYVRWYLTDLDGNEIPIGNFTSGQAYAAAGGNNGYYRKGFDASNFNDEGSGTAYNPTITLPGGYTYDQVRVVCVATTKTDGYTDSPWNSDPDEIQVKYVYTLHTQDELADQPFVHYQGEGYRYLIEIGNDEKAANYDYIKPAEATGVQGYIWDSSTNSYTTTSELVRQNVHTVDYYYYLNLNENETASLILPLQHYFDTGNDTEPRGYFRWYDYKTDAKSDYLTNPGSSLVEKDYGFIALPSGDDPTQARIGIGFKAPSGFSSLTDEILIACDVSRYMDGMDDSYTYLVHEPTLSIRYLFHILPASVVADEIETKANANSSGSQTGLAAVEEKITTRTANEKISILENDGRVVISTNNGVGDFSLRTDLSSLGHYYVKNGGISAANQLQWYAYYQDADGNWWKKTIEMGARGGGIQAKYSLADFTGDWTRISGSSGSTPTIGVGDHVQMVACAGDGTVEMPIIWTELVFIDAAPQALGSEETERTDAYMNREYSHAKTLDFNEFFRVGLKTPENSFDNYTKIPLEIPDAQYGFCYPQLYGFCATNKYAGWGEYGIAPLHGDYTLLKSMNMYGISQSDERDIQNIYCRWWWGDKLFDITHERASGKGTSDTNDYGAFLYVDAADEARTIATLEFDAALCHDAKIYYTAYVASMTNNITKPMVRFRVMTDDDEHPGEHVPVVAFVTGDLYSELGTNPYESDEARVRHEAQWYQVYGYTTIPSELNNLLTGNTRHYYVEIDNYCDNTEGADYCVDQISFYTYSAKVRAEVAIEKCDGVEEKSSVKIVADAKTLIEQIRDYATDGKKTVFYRIYEKIDDVNHVVQEGEELTGEGVYTSASGAATNLYGAVTINVNYDWESVTSTTPVGGIYLNGTPSPNSGFFMGTDGEIYFQFAEHGFVLEPGKRYYVSFYDFNWETVNTPAGWGNPYNGNACSVFSNDILANKVYLDLIDGDSEEVSNGTVNFGCGVASVTKTYGIKVQYPTEDGGYRTYSDIKFDFFLHSTSTTNAKTTFNGIAGLAEALAALRDIDQNTYTSSADLPAASGAFTDEMRDLLVEYMDHTEAEGKLLLSASTKFNYTFTTPGERHFASLPVDKQTSDGDDICSPIDMKFIIDASIGGPQMTLGFDDVDYPVSYTRQVVRVGLEQLRMMKEEGYKLHIPVRTYKDKSQGTTKRLYFPADPILTISAVDKTLAPENQRPKTSDPVLLAMENEAVGKKFAEIVAPSGGGRPYVNKTHMYLPLDLSGCEIDFHEGYEYEVSTSFMDEDDESAITPCYGDIFLVIKVVPEFVTWDAQVLGTLHEVDYYNASWYYDENWKRSGRTELYKGARGSATNTASAGHPEGYDNNEEIDALLMTSPGYVPMKFTYVTLLTDNHAPSLIGEPKVTEDGKSSPSQGGGLIDPSMITGTQMYTDPSPSSTDISSYPTENIRYDMLVRYGTHAQGGVGCFGHRYLDEDGVWGDDGESPEQPTAKVFDVEKFYGNICKEIYFKPGAELLKQNRLTYEKAWVEKELVANKWYLMASPLKATYAGDMYVPYNSSDAAKNGRQESEAFQNIEFSTAANAAGFAYSRTKYPIYQRSWGQTANVYTKTTDIRSTDYSAKINFESVTSNLAEWGHTYNDVQVPYTTKGGFSVRAHKKDQKDGSDDDIPALIRLPKYDTSFDYYQWDNTSPAEGKVTQEVTKGEDYARLLDITDKQIVIPVANLQAQGTDESGNTYYLVGNPFISAIDMGEFFKFNTDFDKSYYIYEAGTMMAVDATDTPDATLKHIIKPTQAFFLKCTAGDAPENVVFHTDMMTDGNYEIGTAYSEPAPARYKAVTLRASNGKGGSEASVEINDHASADYANGEDVTTLFDSNLADVPIVFTVAGSHALSIDTRPTLELIPFGVACASSDELVEVTIDSSLFTLHSSLLYVFDALTGNMAEVGEGSAFMLQPNDYGRYFLTTDKNITGIYDTTVADGIVVSVRGHVVTVRSQEPISLVRVLSFGGETLNSLQPGTTETSLSLNGGAYIVEIQTTTTKKTMKIMVKGN